MHLGPLSYYRAYLRIIGAAWEATKIPEAPRLGGTDLQPAAAGDRRSEKLAEGSSEVSEAPAALKVLRPSGSLENSGAQIVGLLF